MSLCRENASLEFTKVIKSKFVDYGLLVIFVTTANESGLLNSIDIIFDRCVFSPLQVNDYVDSAQTKQVIYTDGGVNEETNIFITPISWNSSVYPNIQPSYLGEAPRVSSRTFEVFYGYPQSNYFKTDVAQTLKTKSLGVNQRRLKEGDQDRAVFVLSSGYIEVNKWYGYSQREAFPTE